MAAVKTEVSAVKEKIEHFYMLFHGKVNDLSDLLDEKAQSLSGKIEEKANGLRQNIQDVKMEATRQAKKIIFLERLGWIMLGLVVGIGLTRPDVLATLSRILAVP